MNVRYSIDARRHIAGIFEYVNLQNSSAASRVVERIRTTVRRIAGFPHIGHLGTDKGTYELSVPGSPYIIVYEVNEAANEIAIIAVFHGAQDR